jgi:thiol-disulfide isomerase/thioredoxin
MKNKSLLLIYTCFFLDFAGVAQNKYFVEIKGTLIHFSNQVEVQDMSEFQYLLPPTSGRIIIPGDSSGRFTIKFPLSSPNYFRIGRNTLFLSPGDNLTVSIDYNNPALASFKGKGSQANMYMRFTPFPKGGSYIEAGSKAKATPQQTIDYIIDAAKLRTKQLDSLTQVSAEFKKLETGRIKADIINSLQAGQITFYRPRAIQKDSVKMKIYGDEYAALIVPLVKQYSKDFTDASLLKIVVYRDLVDSLVNQPGNTAILQQMQDWIKASAIIDDMKKVSDKQLLADFKPKIESVKTTKYKNALLTSWATLLKFGKGDTAVDFSVTDINGNKILLSSLKGKVIYLDLWATWCGPCMEEMPHYETLKEKYRNNPGIVFVSLSIDDNSILWKSNVDKRKADGYQWLINRNKLDAYNIVAIPRTLLIDKNFKIFDMNAPVPSSKKLPGIIEGLLQ